MPHVGSGELIESGEGLVHQYERSLEREGPDQTNSLLHSAGQFVRICLDEVAQADRSKEFIDIAGALLANVGIYVEENTGVGGDRSPRKECRRLRDEGDLFT